MRYLIKLVTPPNGTVLDPFLGSGTTAVAATLDNFNWVGCEMTDDYLPIIKGRVDWATKENKKAKQQELDLYENN
jgi:site-specific DNA-methyltransferase (adenine-specific)